MIFNNDKILHKNNRVLIKNETLVSVPTFIIIGDSNADGRGALEKISISKYFSEWATNIIHSQKPTVKIFDSITTQKFKILSSENSIINAANYQFGYEQTIGYGLARHYGNSQIRIIKYGISSGTCGTGTNPGLSFQPGAYQMNIFEGIYNNAVLAAANDGEQLDIVACITWLGTNDGVELTLANNYEENMTNVIEHLRTNIFNNESVPFIITSCTDTVAYKDTVRAAQQDVCANVPYCSYFNLHRFSNGVSHTAIAGIFTAGLEIARTIIINLLSGTDYLDDYIFSFQTNRNGTFALTFAFVENIFGEFYIDWGDGSAETEITASSATYNHTFTDGTTKTVKIKVMCPWNIVNLLINNTSSSNLIGTLDLSQMTGLDTFRTSTANSGLTAIIPPVSNFGQYTIFASALLNGSGIANFDLARYQNMVSLGLGVVGTSIITLTDSSNANKVYNEAISISTCANLESIDLGNVIAKLNSVLNCPKLTTFVHPKSTFVMISSFLASGNTILTEIQNYKYSIYAISYDVRNCDLSRTNVDDIINEMWDRARDTYRYYSAANKSAYFTGNNGVTGTFDGTTDWSGGLPTSPAAKAYDLLNDVTGTYNFSTFSI